MFLKISKLRQFIFETISENDPIGVIISYVKDGDQSKYEAIDAIRALASLKHQGLDDKVFRILSMLINLAEDGMTDETDYNNVKSMLQRFQ